MDEIHNYCWPVGWTKWHYCVSSLYSINPLKGKLLLTLLCNSELMIPHRRVKHPNESPHAEFDKDCSIASGDGVSNNTLDALQGNIVDTETPNEVLNILDMLLMGFRHK